MENSKTSMSCKSTPPKEKTEDHCSDNEESSWTFYFEDFLGAEKNQHNSSLSSGCGRSGSPNSLVSDAASCVGKKFEDNNVKKRLSFKKRKETEGTLVDFDGHDHALLDTASSPVNSPKVCCLDQFDMNRPGKDDHTDNVSEEKSNSISGSQTNERSDELCMVGKSG